VSLPEKIKTLRKKKGWSQAEFGRYLGIHGGHISRLETGMFNPSVDLLKKIADVFQVSADYLLSEHDEMSEVRLEDQIFAEKIQLLNTLEGKDKEVVMHIIDTILTKKKMVELLSHELKPQGAATE